MDAQKRPLAVHKWNSMLRLIMWNTFTVRFGEKFDKFYSVCVKCGFPQLSNDAKHFAAGNHEDSETLVFRPRPTADIGFRPTYLTCRPEGKEEGGDDAE
eukprot:gene1845-1256_t